MTGFVKKMDHAATNRKVYTAEDVAVHYCEAVELKTVPFRMIVGPDGAGLTYLLLLQINCTSVQSYEAYVQPLVITHFYGNI
jgi:hypothetical protein